MSLRLFALLSFSLLLLLQSNLKLVDGSSGGALPFFRHPINIQSSPSYYFGRRSLPKESSTIHTKPLNPRAQRYLAKLALDDALRSSSCRGGQDWQGDAAFVKVVGTVTSALVQCGKFVLPPIVCVTRTLFRIYRALPRDAILAQVGLVYCFAGGYYPTLFSSLAAAQQCGWSVVVQAISELTDEAVRVLDALEGTSVYGWGDGAASAAHKFRQNTAVILATVDPIKINRAAGALYTTWLGVSSVLEKEYARVITLSVTMAEYLETMACFLLAPAVKLCVAQDYHQWIPVLIGWTCKAAAMNLAWRVQRILTAGTSAVAGGLIFARACARMLSKRGIRLFGWLPSDDNHQSTTVFDEIVGFLVAGLGFYTQWESQWRSRFAFTVPFPLSLITWPFELAERWIQWQITK